MVQALLDKHKPAIAEGPAKPKVGTATIKKSPATNGISKNDALDPNKAKTVRPGTKPVAVSNKSTWRFVPSMLIMQSQLGEPRQPKGFRMCQETVRKPRLKEDFGKLAQFF